LATFWFFTHLYRTMQVPPISFDHWTIIFALAAMQGIGLVALLVTGRKRLYMPNRILAALIGVFTLLLFYYVAFWSNILVNFPLLLNVGAVLPFLLGPLLLLYVKKLLQQDVSRQFFVHFLPAALFLGLFVPYYFSSGTYKLDLLFGHAQSSYFQYLGAILVYSQNLHLLLYTILIFAFLRRYRLGMVPDFRKEIRWLHWMAGAFALFTSSFLSYYIMAWTGVLQLEYDYAVSFSMTLAIYLVGYAGFARPDLFQKEEQAIIKKQEEKYSNSGLSEEDVERYWQQLERHMLENQPYLNNDLKLPLLAKQIGLLPHQLSQIINQKARMKYGDYINHYRIEAAKERLRNPKFDNLTIMAIAYDVGYNTKSAFYTAFKKMVNSSPAQYRQQEEKNWEPMVIPLNQR